MDVHDGNCTTDAVLEETRRIKDTLAASMDYDITRILEASRRKQYSGGRNISPVPPLPPLPPPAHHSDHNPPAPSIQ